MAENGIVLQQHSARRTRLSILCAGGRVRGEKILLTGSLWSGVDRGGFWCFDVDVQ